MKKVWNVFVLTLAINFVAVAGGVAYLYGQGRLDRKRVDAIRLVLYPPPATQPAATQPLDARNGNEPVLRLGELLEQKSGLSTGEQLSLLQGRSFNAQDGRTGPASSRKTGGKARLLFQQFAQPQHRLVPVPGVERLCGSGLRRRRRGRAPARSRRPFGVPRPCPYR